MSKFYNIHFRETITNTRDRTIFLTLNIKTFMNCNIKILKKTLIKLYIKAISDIKKYFQKEKFYESKSKKINKDNVKDAEYEEK